MVLVTSRRCSCFFFLQHLTRTHMMRWYCFHSLTRRLCFLRVQSKQIDEVVSKSAETIFLGSNVNVCPEARKALGKSCTT
ncbi:unnamed protein product [Amoebophrya sp. A120]|nr:unnamed protein product [Amoebophrya sp. A120]|eukprot:GSA120T00025834001.1